MAPSNELPGSVVGRFRLAQRLGGPRSSVWSAEDDRGRKVVVEILARTLPADPARRSALVQRIRQRAALHHLGLVAIHDVIVDGDILAIQIEPLEGTSLDDLPKPFPAPALMKLAWQLADTLAWLHQKGLVHGTLSPAAVLVTPDEDAKLGGFTLAALVGRPDRGEDRLLKSSDPDDVRAILYRAPEQLVGKPLDERSDIYSLGAVLFHAATGKDLFQAASAADAASAVVRNSPPSPLEANPRMSGKIADVISRCIPKDPYRRYTNARVLLDDLRKIDSQLPQTAARTINTMTRRAEAARQADTPLVVALLPYFELLEKTDPAKASRLSARMHQILGEAVLLFDGKILDSLGARFVATVSTAGAAIDAVRHGLRDLREVNSEHEADGEILEPTILVHAGSIVMTGAEVSGEPLDLATRIAHSMEPGQALASDPIASAAGMSANAKQVGEIDGVGLWSIDLEPPRKAAEVAEPAPTLADAPRASSGVTPATPAARTPSRRRIAWIAGAAIVLLVAIALVVFLPKKESGPLGGPAITGSRGGSSTQASSSGGIYLSGFASAPVGPELAARAAAIEEAVRRLLAAVPGVRIATDPSGATTHVSARAIADGPPGNLVAFAGDGAVEGPRVSLSEPGNAAAEIARWIASSQGIPVDRIGSASPQALTSFVQAVEVLSTAQGASDPRALALLRSALESDPRFVAAAQAALPLLEASGDRAGAIAAAEVVVEAAPENDEMRRTVFAWCAQGRQIEPALRHAAALAERQDDREALLFIGRHALGVADAAAFQHVLPRIEAAWGTKTPLHAADLVAAQGRLAAAVQQYYAVEPNQPENAALALKVGRIGVLRHSLPVAEFELEKLEKLDPAYGAPLLRAFIAAEKRDPASARRELALAGRAATPDLGFHAAAAEVHALLSDHAAVLQSIRSAIEVREPSLAYIEANPVFAYLRDDPRFIELRGDIDRAQAEIREGLAAVQ